MAFHRTHHFDADLQQLANLAKCLSHPARVRLIENLVDSGPSTFERLSSTLPLSQSTVSYHLKYLVQHGLLEVAERLPHTYYAFSSEGFAHQVQLTNRLLDSLLVQ